MAAFSYQAVDGTGKRTRGVIEAGNLSGARRALRERALLPLSVAQTHRPEAANAAGAPVPLAERLRWRGRVSSRALSTATRQLATLIGADVRIEEALRLVANQAENAALKSILLDVRSAVLEGASFARGLARHPKAFPDFFHASIEAGERSGRVPEVLSYLADFVEARHRANQKVRLALLYPALLAGVAVSMMTLMMIYVVPDIVRVFVTRGADLPLLTRLLIALSHFVSAYGLVVLAALIGGLVFARHELAKPDKRRALHRALATRRPLARFVRQANSARFTATLATLVQSRVPLLDALTAAAAVIPNLHVRAQAEAVAARVREGDSVHGAMGQADAFPSMLVAIVASGESTGKLGPALARAATELDRDVEAQVAVMVSLVEPAVLLLMGGLVLLMVMAILLPIIGLNDLATV
ncbi:MAG: type II secretion system F family protein [Croceibacterium sp.]